MFKSFRGAWLPLSSNSCFDIETYSLCCAVVHWCTLCTVQLSDTFWHGVICFFTSHPQSLCAFPECSQPFVSYQCVWRPSRRNRHQHSRGMGNLAWGESQNLMITPLTFGTVTFFMLRMTCAVSRLRTLPTGLRASRTPRICCCLSWLDHNCNKYEDASQTDSNDTLWPMAYASRMIPLPAQECNTVQQQQQQQQAQKTHRTITRAV